MAENPTSLKYCRTGGSRCQTLPSSQRQNLLNVPRVPQPDDFVGADMAQILQMGFTALAAMQITLVAKYAADGSVNSQATDWAILQSRIGTDIL